MLFAQLRIEVQLNLQEIDRGRFEMYAIENSCKLREAAPFKKLGHFKRGYAYYEFKHEKENISEDKEIILMHKVASLTLVARIMLIILIVYFVGHWTFFHSWTGSCPRYSSTV